MDGMSFTTSLIVVGYLTLVSGKTEVRVLVPPVVRRGSTVTLVCLHNLTSDNLYTVKWYRGYYEFYRFVPRDHPPITTFPLPGLEVDTNGSSAQQVTVRVLEHHISGTFTCEVSAEGPSFSTDKDSARLSVIDIGVRRPLLKAASSVHLAGTPLEVNCSAQPTVPPPHIAFYIDNVRANMEWVRNVQPGLASLRVLQLSPQDGPHWVSCEASVPGVYQLASASIPILEQQPLPESSSTMISKSPKISAFLCFIFFGLVHNRSMYFSSLQ